MAGTRSVDAVLARHELDLPNLVPQALVREDVDFVQRLEILRVRHALEQVHGRKGARDDAYGGLPADMPRQGYRRFSAPPAIACSGTLPLASLRIFGLSSAPRAEGGPSNAET
jgi:hypothetical protein